MAVLIVIVFALIGCVAFILLGTAIGPVFGFPNMEGSSAIFGVMIAGPIGALLGVAIGKALTKRVTEGAARKKLLAVTLAVIGLFVLVSVVLEMNRTSDRLSQSASTIAYEIRLPPGVAAPARKEDAHIELRSVKDHGKAQMYDGLWLRDDNGRAVVRGIIEMFYTAPERTIAARFGNGPTYLFKLRIPPRPVSSKGFYEAWFPVDQIDENTPGKLPRPPGPDEIAEIRHFVTVPR